MAQLPGDLHSTIRDIIERCIAFNKDDRPTMQEVFKWLHELRARVVVADAHTTGTDSATSFGSLPLSTLTPAPVPKRYKLWNRIRKAAPAIAVPVALLCGIVVIGVAAGGIRQLLLRYRPSQELDTLKLLAVRAPNPYYIPPYNPIEALQAVVPKTGQRVVEPVILQYLRFWNKVLPPPF